MLRLVEDDTAALREGGSDGALRNRDLRFLFLNLEDCLEVRFLGNLDEIRREIKGGK